MSPPSWYPDPTDATRLRWWDGQKWTADTRAALPTHCADLVSTPRAGVAPVLEAADAADTATVGAATRTADSAAGCSGSGRAAGSRRTPRRARRRIGIAGLVVSVAAAALARSMAGSGHWAVFERTVSAQLVERYRAVGIATMVTDLTCPGFDEDSTIYNLTCAVSFRDGQGLQEVRVIGTRAGKQVTLYTDPKYGVVDNGTLERRVAQRLDNPTRPMHRNDVICDSEGVLTVLVPGTTIDCRAGTVSVRLTIGPDGSETLTAS